MPRPIYPSNFADAGLRFYAIKLAKVQEGVDFFGFY